jgi:hypothetical protein
MSLKLRLLGRIVLNGTDSAHHTGGAGGRGPYGTGEGFAVGARHQRDRWGGPPLFDEPDSSTAHPNQHLDRARVRHRRCGWVADHPDTAYPWDSLLRSCVGVRSRSRVPGLVREDELGTS